jgi:membrane fusion protein (multidrug efflux system)
MSDAPAPRAAAPKRRGRLILLAAAVALALGGYGLWWYTHGRFVEGTDDAYVAGDVVQITAEAPGTVTLLQADDTQSVTRGQTLLELDPSDAEVAMQAAEAELARAVRQVRGQFAQAAQLRAQIGERDVALQRAQADFKRRAGLAGEGAVSSEELAHARESVDQAQAAIAAAREQLNAIQAQIEGTRIATHPQVLAAEAAVRSAALALRRTRVAAPVAGVVARRTVQVGQRVAPGTPLMSVVPLENVWVEANFKEVQLENLRIGQPVRLRADVYGDEVDYHGRIVGLSAGSGAAFALLPAQNASGNWIKIVQRVPVRVALDAKELKAHPLRLGLSMDVAVDIHDLSGAQLASQVRSDALPRQASHAEDPAVQARIDRIVAEHAGADAQP